MTPILLHEFHTLISTSILAPFFSRLFSRACFFPRRAQVLTLMWLRTVMNFQYRYGTSTSSALCTLWSEGGIRRLYQGWQYAILVSPLSRFGDTAANSGVLALLAATEIGAALPLGVRTAQMRRGAASASLSCAPRFTSSKLAAASPRRPEWPDDDDNTVCVAALWWGVSGRGGPGVFWDGLGPKLARAVVNHAVTFLVYEEFCALALS